MEMLVSCGVYEAEKIYLAGYLSGSDGSVMIQQCGIERESNKPLKVLYVPEAVRREDRFPLGSDLVQ